MASKNWFEVSKDGLRQLQEGKPKSYIVRELVQNAWDEETKECLLDLNWSRGKAEISIEDDSPEGFRDLSHAYTLFAPTDKRADPEKRGRFNIGEKQAFSLAEYAKVETTKGTIVFDKKGRHAKKSRRKAGSKITVLVKMTKEEFKEMVDTVDSYLPPEGIDFLVNGTKVPYRKPYKVTEATLPTVYGKKGVYKPTQRKTKVHILEARGQTRLYEMGIPVTEIDSKYDIDVQQKVPLSYDRETVPASFLSQLYAVVLNATYEDIQTDEASQVWIREATANKKIAPEAVRGVVRARYGDKVVVANPSDRRSIDDAIANGYRVVYSREMSTEEWNNVRDADAIKPSSEVFPTKAVGADFVEPDENMTKAADLAKKIAKKFLGIEIDVKFLSWEGSIAASFGGNVLSFNVRSLGKRFFDPPVSAGVIDLIVHEIGHHAGMHTEKAYHESLTKLAGALSHDGVERPGVL